MVPSARHGLHLGRRRSQWRERDAQEWQSLLAHPRELVRLPVSWLTRMAALPGPSRTCLRCPRVARRSVDESQIDKKLIEADKLKHEKGVRGIETRNSVCWANQISTYRLTECSKAKTGADSESDKSPFSSPRFSHLRFTLNSVCPRC